MSNCHLVTVLQLSNLFQLLAVVYDAFTTIEKEKFRKLIIHKQKASTYAFNLLVSKGNPDGVIFRHFHGMMSYVDSQKCKSIPKAGMRNLSSLP